MGRWKPQSQHGKGKTTDSPQEGGNNRVTMGRWKLQSHHWKVETTESPWEGGNHRVTMAKVEITESQWKGGNHRDTMGKVETRVTMRRWKPQSQHGKAETSESPQEGANHGVITGG